MVMPVQGPTWYSHCEGITSALIPEICNASEKTSLVVSLDNVTAVDFAVTDTAVVRTLGSGETTNRPAVGVSKVIKKGVLLLNTEPNVSSIVSIHELSTLVSVVGAVGGTIGVVALSKNNDVVTKS